jgi:ABC-type dipeptide/oligopeptide/nickel transport system ATPase subunit
MGQVYCNIRIEKTVNVVRMDQVSDRCPSSMSRRVLMNKRHRLASLREVRATTHCFVFTCLIGHLDLLSKLHPVTAAFHDADVAAPTCLSGTRAALLEEIRTWFDDNSDNCPRFFWLSGIAGTGKTTVAQSVCEMLSDRLAGTFFFSRDSAERRRPSNILPTLMYSLAYSWPAFRQSICDVIEQNPDVSSKAVQIQMQKLISEGMKNVQGTTQPSLLFVLDALDECDKEGGREGGPFLPLLIARLSSLPYPVKVFMTSRPEPSITKMVESSTSPTRPFVLHQIEAPVVQADIERYLREEFAKILQQHDMQPPWPTEAQLRLLVQLAGCLFIYAATVVKFVSDSIHPSSSLVMFLSADTRTSQHAHATLDSVYLQIIRVFTKDPTGSASAIFREVVGAIIALQQPLSRITLGKLLQIEMEKVNGTLRYLHSLVDVGTTPNHPIRAFHPSLYDFLTHPERCTDGDLRVSVGDTHLLLAIRCLRVMNRQLKQDICEIGNPSLLNSEVPDLAERRNRLISEELRYACVYWMSHLASIRTSVDVNELEAELNSFCTRHLLQWIETLSIVRELRSAVEGLPVICAWLKVRVVELRARMLGS